MASSGLCHDCRLIEEGFAGTDGFREGGGGGLVFPRGALQENRRFRRGDVGFTRRVVLYL